MTSLRGRQAEARRNDALVLDAALDVLSADPGAPMSAVARSAGVGQATLYRRYPSKEALLLAVGRHTLESITAAARAARDEPDAWAALRQFLHWYATSGTLRTAGLRGSFTPDRELFEIAHQGNLAMQELVDRARDAELLRPDVTGADLTLIATQVAALTGADPDRTAGLRRRYVELALQGLSLRDAPDLPGPAPSGEELEAPWHEPAGPVAPPS